MQERAGDFIAASSVERLSELEGTVASQATQIRELEQQVADKDAVGRMSRATVWVVTTPNPSLGLRQVCQFALLQFPLRLLLQLSRVRERVLPSWLLFFLFICHHLYLKGMPR